MQEPNWSRRDLLRAAVLWAVLTVIGEIVVWGWIRSIMPERYAETATIVDDAFLYLTALAVPVFAFVISAVAVSMIWHRADGPPADDGSSDGPPLRASKPLLGTWLAITSALALSLIVFPGIVGLVQLGAQADVTEDEVLVVRLDAARWAWTATYPAAGITTGEEMVLPVERPIRFEITSKDILHSFWIPAFRIKIDAVPGAVTEAHVTPEKTGSMDEDPLMRIQCAELCGLNHSTMLMPVRVVETEEFDAWLTEQVGPAETCEPDGTELTIVAKDIAFDQKCLAAPADEPFTITLDNQDDGIPHNISIAADAGWNDVLFTGATFNGIATQTEDVPGLPAGNYFFRCDVHPIPAMSGTFIVK
jgi:cytochrome c oxidase subunit 2